MLIPNTESATKLSVGWCFEVAAGAITRGRGNQSKLKREQCMNLQKRNLKPLKQN
jgi:hypothetical protein